MSYSNTHTQDQRLAQALGLETTPAERQKSTQKAWQRFQHKRAQQAAAPSREKS